MCFRLDGYDRLGNGLLPLILGIYGSETGHV